MNYHTRGMVQPSWRIQCTKTRHRHN